jgi:hypothetical protein
MTLYVQSKTMFLCVKKLLNQFVLICVIRVLTIQSIQNRGFRSQFH